jgi:hypothetical protein
VRERLSIGQCSDSVIPLVQRDLPVVHAELGARAHSTMVLRDGDDLLGGEAERQWRGGRHGRASSTRWVSPMT